MIGAENLVRDEILSKTPIGNRRQSADASSIARKNVNPMTSSKYKRVESWLKNQSQSKLVPPTSVTANTTDGEASYEYTTDSRDSDSEELADSVATTCLPGNGNKSYTSTEKIGGSGDLLKESPETNCALTKVIPRTKRRNSERPLSVSCISQLTTQKPVTCLSDDANNQGLANHSISESALNTLNINLSSLRMRNSDSKNSLKRRRMRMKKKQRSESGSNASEAAGSNQRGNFNSLLKSETTSNNVCVIKEAKTDAIDKPNVDNENEEETSLPKPNFQLGAFKSNVFNPIQLGTLAPLAYYNLDGNIRNRELSYTGTEDNSNLSEQVWDDYQEKYMSEAYSEGRDSDAARKLLEFGDDYRNFIDSQSDCCSSLSAANNLDSMSPPRGRKPFANMPIANKSLSKSPSDEDNAMRRRRTLEIEIERRKRFHAENHRKLSNEGKDIS